MTTPLHVSECGLERFQDDLFGMFVYWGLYSLIGANEWVMFHERYSAEEYERLATRFAAAFGVASKLYELIHTLQPGAVVMNNHHSDPEPGEDIQGG